MFITLEFDTLAEAEAAVKQLRTKHKVTGEFHVKPTKDKGWRLKFHSEKTLRSATIDKLPGRRVDLA